METDYCPKIEKCPLFNGRLLKRKGSEESFKNLYCKAGKEKWASCKRYQTTNKTGKCANWVLPNCTLDLDEIEAMMQSESL